MRKHLIYNSIIVLLISIFALPIDINAKTIAEFEAEVEKYTAQLEEKKNNLAKNDAEVAAIKAKIASIEGEIAKAEEEINTLQQEIDASNEEIAEKSEESKKILEYYQISNGENIYLEYAFGATSITDMIYRMSVVEQLTEYNEQIMKELEMLIEKNKQQQEELSKKRTELRELKSSLEAQKERINADSASLRAAVPNIENQIKEAKDNLKYYQSLGCGKTEDIQACQYRIEQSNSGSSLPSTNGFYRPMQYGYLTQGYVGYGGHLGVDLSSSNKAIDIYPIASGVIHNIYTDDWGALCVKVKHNVNGSYIYSTYAHLSSFANIYVGQYVTAFTKLGQMGNTGYSFGSHLHLEMTTCDWSNKGGCTWSTYQTKTVNPTRYINIPSSWSNR